MKLRRFCNLRMKSRLTCSCGLELDDLRGVLLTFNFLFKSSDHFKCSVDSWKKSEERSKNSPHEFKEVETHCYFLCLGILFYASECVRDYLEKTN